MKSETKSYTSIAILFLFSWILIPGLYAQPKAAVKKNSSSRSAYELMNLITNHQLNEMVLKDGDYAKGSWEDVKKSALPTAMYWSYPTGVTLLGMQRVYAITKDEKIMDFVNANNRISAEQYAYSALAEKSVRSSV